MDHGEGWATDRARQQSPCEQNGRGLRPQAICVLKLDEDIVNRSLDTTNENRTLAVLFTPFGIQTRKLDVSMFDPFRTLGVCCSQPGEAGRWWCDTMYGLLQCRSPKAVSGGSRFAPLQCCLGWDRLQAGSQRRSQETHQPLLTHTELCRFAGPTPPPCSVPPRRNCPQDAAALSMKPT